MVMSRQVNRLQKVRVRQLNTIVNNRLQLNTSFSIKTIIHQSLYLPRQTMFIFFYKHPYLSWPMFWKKCCLKWLWLPANYGVLSCVSFTLQLAYNQPNNMTATITHYQIYTFIIFILMIFWVSYNKTISYYILHNIYSNWRKDNVQLG